MYISNVLINSYVEKTIGLKSILKPQPPVIKIMVKMGTTHLAPLSFGNLSVFFSFFFCPPRTRRHRAVEPPQYPFQEFLGYLSLLDYLG